MEELVRAALTNALTATALAAVAAGLALILARWPAIVHCIWVVVLLKLVTPPLFEVPIPRLASESEPATELVAVSLADLEGIDWEAVAASEPTEVAEAAVEPAWTFDAALMWKSLAVLWLSGSLATAVLAGVRILRFQRRLREASPAGWAVDDEVADLAARMGLRRVPLVDVVDARTTPMLWGLGLRPRLILPRMLWKEMDGRRRTLLLTHELAHLKRGDHLLRFFELAVTVLYWWLPVVWLVRRALRDAEEQCCDAWVVWMFPDDARAYAETLLDTVDFLNPGAEPEPLLASGFGKVQHLRKRLTMVMKGTTPRALGWKGGLTALALSGVLLPMSPTWAQKAGEETATATATASADGVDETSTVVVDAKNDSPDVLTFRAVAVDGKPATVEVIGKDANLNADSVVVWRNNKDGEAKTITVTGTDAKITDVTPGVVTVRSRGDALTRVDVNGPSIAFNLDDEKDKNARDGDKKDRSQVRGRLGYLEYRENDDARDSEIRLFRGAPAEAREGLKKAAEDLKGRIKELESKKGDGPEAEAQIKTLKAALEQIEKMSNSPDGAFSFAGRPNAPADVKVFRRDAKPDDPKAQEARKQVEELRKVLAEKQKEMSEAAAKLAKAQAELAKLSQHVETIQWGDDLQLKGVRSINFTPRVAEGRAIISSGSDPKDKARIDALEKKLDRVLEQLEGLKKPERDARR